MDPLSDVFAPSPLRPQVLPHIAQVASWVENILKLFTLKDGTWGNLAGQCRFSLVKSVANLGPRRRPERREEGLPLR